MSASQGAEKPDSTALTFVRHGAKLRAERIDSMYLARVLMLSLALGLLLGGPLYATPYPAAAQAERCFPETGYCIVGRFLEYWEANGGLARNGYPVGVPRMEMLEDGKEYMVQYFERVRLEHHPENPAPYDVLLGQFGRRILAESYVVRRSAYAGAVERATPIDGQIYFAETGHNLGGRFLAYWQANGGLAQFGYPITEERYDGLPAPGGGACCVTQYFERARFEYHPENEGTPYEVLLGQFGRQIASENAKLAGEFRRLFLADPGLQVRLGAPVSNYTPSPGATQPFERGRMFYAMQAPSQGLIGGGFLDPGARPRSAVAATLQATDEEREPTIYVLCGTPERGEVRTSTPDFAYFWRDTWTEDQQAGGGPGPRPGLYEPQRGFGKVWRGRTLDNGLTTTGARDCLGYATTAGETGYPIAVQYFQGGAMFDSDTPEGRYLYVLTVGRYTNSGPPAGTYERYPLP